jgi:Tol biopolymer transport system component
MPLVFPRAAATAAVTLAAAATIASCARTPRPASPVAGADPYGGPPPGAPAVRFAPGAVSDGNTFSAAFTPDGRTVFVSRRGPNRTGARLFVARFVDGRWTDATPVAATSRYPSADPFLTRDGRRLYFSWQSPRPGMAADTAVDYDTWVMDRDGDGWGPPRHVGDAPHSSASDMYPSVARDGTLYFDSTRPGLPARRNLWRARSVNGAYAPAEPLPDIVNGAGGASNPYVDPDERFVIFQSSREGGLGGGDLWIAYRTPTGWSTPKNLGPRVNTADAEFCPTVTPDGRYLVFSRIRVENGRQVADDVFIVGADVLPVP